MFKEGFIIPFILAYPEHFRPLFFDETTLTVHSVFKNTINIAAQEWFIALQPAGLPTSPMSFSLGLDAEGFSRLGIKAGDSCRIDQTGLHLDSLHFDHREADCFQCDLRNLKLTSSSVIYAMATLEAVLQEPNGNGQLLNAYKVNQNGSNTDSSLFNVIAQRVLSTLSHDPDDEAVLRETQRLVGLGEGLTPSGDDFVCGIMAAFTVLDDTPSIVRLRQRMSAMIDDHSSSTTKISQHYLNYATKGLFSTLTKDFFMAIGHRSPCDRILRDIQSIGHSSGTDFLLGVYYGLKIGGNRNHDLQHD